MTNLYQLLGISPLASSDEIGRALTRAAEKRLLTLEQLQKVKSVLLNNERRQQYDAKLKQQQPDAFVVSTPPIAPKLQAEPTAQITPLSTPPAADSRLQKFKQWQKNRSYTFFQITGVGVCCLLVGWFGGREYLKHQMTEAVKEAFSFKSDDTDGKADKPAAKPKLAKKAETDEALPTTWKYTTRHDEMRGSNSLAATVASTNEYNLGFPYEHVVGGLIVARGEAETVEQSRIALFVTGQITCRSASEPFDSCVISVKFDDNPVERIRVQKLDDLTSHVTVDNADRPAFIRNLRSSKHLTVELPMFQAADKQFNFNVSGFKW